MWLQTSPKFIKLESVYDYIALCKKFRIIFERRHEKFSQKIYNQLITHRTCFINHETRYSKSKCQNAVYFLGKKLWNTTPNDIKHSVNLARLTKYLKRFIPSSSDSPD